MMRVLRGICLLFCVLAVMPVCALDPTRPAAEFTLESFDTEDGLPQSSVMSLVQCRNGYIWMGTFEGLARFDGTRFHVFDKNTVPLMENNTIKALLEDADGCLWIGTPNGLLCYRNGTFRRFTTDDGLVGNFVLSLAAGADGSVWIGTTHGLNRYHNGAFHTYVREDGLIDEYVAVLAADGDGGVWIGTQGGLDRLDNGTFTHYSQRDGLPGRDIRCLYRAPDGTLWVGTAEGGLAREHNGRFQAFGETEGLTHPDVRSVLQDRDGNLWIGTNGGGLFRMVDGRIRLALSEREGLRNNSVRSLLEDREGSIWIGTRDGLYQLKEDKFTILSSRNGLPVDSVRSVFQSSDGAMWIGTVGGGLVRKQGDTVRVFDARDGLMSSYIWSIAEGPDGSIWVGTYGGGLYRIKNGRVRSFTTKNGLSNDIIRAVLVDSRGQVWIGTNGGGIDVLAGNQVLHYSTADGLSEDFIYCLAEGPDGSIWAGTYSGGLNRIRDGRVTVFGRRAGFTNNGVWVIHVDGADGSLWIGTDDAGLFHFADDRFHRFTIRDGLYNDSTFSIIEDEAGNFWMNCNRGIYSVPKADLLALERKERSRVSCLTLGKTDGIKVTESNGPAQPAAVRTEAGAIWFSTIKGVGIIHPDRMKQNPVPPPVVIESVLVNGVPRSVSGPIVVPRGKGDVEIHYTGLSFLLPDKVSFRYRMAGYDQGWNPVGNRRVAYYTNLPPGEYTFQVIAANNDGVWNEEGATLSLTLEPPFTRTPFFYGLMAVLLTFFVAGLYRIRVRSLHRRERELADMVEDRTRQLHELNQKLEYLARTDGLTDIPNHRFMVERLQEEWRGAFRETRPLALLFIDIDRFKQYNDRFGHQAGDQCLRTIAQKLRSELKRPRDFIARYGGEEFVIILPDTDLEGARMIGERLRKSIETFCVDKHRKEKLRVTISVGVASTVPLDQDNYQSLIRAADAALYLAKQQGRNRVAFQEIPPQSEAEPEPSSHS